MSLRCSRAFFALLLALALCACGEPSASPDGGAPLRDAGAGIVVAEPAAPQLSACQPGWTERALDETGPRVCDPPPACGAGLIRWPGASECTPVGAACPAGEWPDDVAAGTRFVRLGASGGDGSRAAPYGSLDEALAAASPGDVLLLGAGVYQGAVQPSLDVELRGVCAERVTLTRTDATGDPIVGVAAARAITLRDLSVTSETHLGILAFGRLVLRGVRVQGAGASVAILRAGSLDAREVHVTHTASDADGRAGRGIDVEAGGVAELERVVVSDSGDSGIAVVFEGSALTARDVEVHGARGNGAGAFGSGVGVFEGATATLERVWISDVREAGLLVSTGSARVSDLFVDGVASEPTQSNGYGVFVREGSLELERAHVTRAHRSGVLAARGAMLTASDLVVHDIAPDADGFGVGLGAVGAELQLARAHFARTATYGVGLLQDADMSPAIARIEDLRVVDVALGSADIGFGLIVSQSQLTLARLQVRGARVLGVDVVGERAEARLEDVRIEEIGTSASFDFGRAIEVDVGGHAVVTRALFRGTTESAAASYEAGSRLELVDVQVREVRERACAASTCRDAPGGVGVVALGGGAIRAERLEVQGAPLCGVMVAFDGSLDLRGGAIRGCAVGACLQVEGYDVARVTDAVVYEDNDVNVDFTGFGVPAGVGAVPEF